MKPAKTFPQSSAQGYVDDPRNDDVLVYVDGEFVPRNRAVVSVFDSGFVLGDGVWEGLRLVNGTRGRKESPNPDPRFAVGRATIVIVAEYKKPAAQAKAAGLSLFTSTFRCSGPDVFDLRLNSHSRLNLIQALIQAINAGADEALMLDPHGFVASCNSTNFFIVRGDELWTSTGR